MRMWWFYDLRSEGGLEICVKGKIFPSTYFTWYSTERNDEKSFADVNFVSIHDHYRHRLTLPLPSFLHPHSPSQMNELTNTTTTYLAGAGLNSPLKTSTSPSNLATRICSSSFSFSLSFNFCSKSAIWSTLFCRYRRAARVLRVRLWTLEFGDEGEEDDAGDLDAGGRAGWVDAEVEAVGGWKEDLEVDALDDALRILSKSLWWKLLEVSEVL